VVIDTSLLYVLSDPKMLSWGLTRRKILAAEAEHFTNFLWNDLWTLRADSARQNRLAQRAKRFLNFNLICSIGLILNVLILNLEFNYCI
jgi:dolichol-phosphate mannosyltransferase